MRITIRIAAGANRSLTRLPLPAVPISRCLDANGKIDATKAALAFRVTDAAEYNPFVAASSDTVRVYFAALVFLDVLKNAYDEATRNAAIDCHATAQSASERKLESKLDSGRTILVRSDIRQRADGSLKVKVTIGNTKNLVGQCCDEARIFAIVSTQLWLRIGEIHPWLSVEADTDILDEAKRKNFAADFRAEHAACPNRVNGYCSPIMPDCPCYRGGRCGYEEMMENPNQGESTDAN